MAEARQFVLNPETGRPAVVVVSHMDIERDALQTALTDANSALEETDSALKTAREQVASLEERRAEQESAQKLAKSELDGYDAVTPGAGNDAGATGASSSVEDSSQPVEDTAEVTDEQPAAFPQVA